MTTDTDITSVEYGRQSSGHYVNNRLVEQVWQDLKGQVPREKIRQVATELEGYFQDAKVTLYIPILLARRTREALQVTLEEMRD